VCLAYLRHFANDAQAVVQHHRVRKILDKPASDALFAILSDTSRRFRGNLFKAVLRFGLKADCPSKRRLYLNIGHTGLDQPGFRAWVGDTGVRPIYLVHDLIPITHPEFCRAGERDRHLARMRTVLATAAGVIGNSRATIDELAAFAAAEGVASPPTVAAWLGTTPLPRPANVEAPDRPTFLVVGTIEGRKNHLLLLRIWTSLVQRLGERALRLLVIGQRGWEAEQAIDILDHSEVLKGSVVEVGHCNDEQLANHFASARALLFPSLAEGFGLPLVEALSVGTPVIASDLEAFREIGLGIPDLLDPLDAPAWERAILDYAEDDSDARRQQLSRMTGYEAPSWDAHFAGVDNWLGQL